MQDYVIVNQKSWEVSSGEFKENTLYYARSINFITYKEVGWCSSDQSAYLVAATIIKSAHYQYTDDPLMYIEQILNVRYEISSTVDYIFVYNHSCFKMFHILDFVFHN